MVMTDMAGILTPQERAVLRGIMRGLDNPEIADELGIKCGTVAVYARSIREKLGGSGQSRRWWVVLGRTWERNKADRES